MTAHTRSTLRQVLAGALAALAAEAGAAGLGELDVRTSLGEPFDATVGLEGATTRPAAGCIRQAQAGSGELPPLPRATLSVEPDGASWRLRVRTRAPIREPALRLRLEAACEGIEAGSRTYDILLDPRAPLPPSPPMQAVAGDSLASIAAAIYPKRRAVRDAYVHALRSANPSLAGLAAEEPIAPGTAIVLPDLRRFSLSLAVPGSPATPAREPAPARDAAKGQRARSPAKPLAQRPAPKPAPQPASQPSPQPAPLPAPQPSQAPAKPPKPAASAASSDAKPAASAAATPQPSRPASAASGAFVLRLSASEVDLSRSRSIDDEARGRLRERLLILDADDQVAALLSMRHSLKQLESRVAELQLKLSTMPAKVPQAPQVPESAKAPQAATAPAPAATPEPPGAAPASPPESARAPGTDQAPQPAAPPAPQATPSPPPVAKAAQPTVRPAPPRAPVAPAGDEGVPPWLWAVLAIAVAGIAVVAWRLVKAPPGTGERAAPPDDTAPASAANSDLEEAEAMMRAGGQDAPGPADHRVVATSDQALSTSVPGSDPVALRRRYIEERYPEIASGTIAPTDPDSVVKAARLFYEDGALARAVELLQFAVEENPRTLKPWLALFEIFRLERLVGEFGDLAGRFRQFHGSGIHWGKVQFIGRELDPGNPLYREAPADHLETIGPAAQHKAPVTFDPLAENWLNAPMDFTTDGLAAGLRAGILADAGLGESDLVADPMPALKNVEMFTVA